MADFIEQLPFLKRLTFGVGHILNDVCASMWFTYLLIYLHNIVEFDAKLAGYLLLLGQIVDGIATPLVGIESDKTHGFCGYTKRKSWHLIGCISVAFSYPLIFSDIWRDFNPDSYARFIFYAPLVTLFQFGWASSQISHLSMIPILTKDDSEKVSLNAIRYTFTVLSNIFVFCLAWILLRNTDAVILCPKDQKVFTILVFTVVGVGIITAIIYHLGCKEPFERRSSTLISESQMRLSTSSCDIRVTTTMWFRQSSFYKIALIYMCTRLIVNITQTYLPMYLQYTVKLDKSYIAIIPLIVYISSFLSSIIIRPINNRIGRKFTFFIGIIFIIASSIWFLFIYNTVSWKKNMIFGASILLGAGGSTMLIMSLSMTSDLIGQHTESGAFVYGAMSFTDKISNGIAVMLIQISNPCDKAGIKNCIETEIFYRNVMSYVPIASAILAFFGLLMLSRTKLGHLNLGNKSIKEIKNENSPLISDQ